MTETERDNLVQLVTTAIAKSLADFGAVREGARRFHRAAIGDMDPRKCFADFLLRIVRGDEAGLEKTYSSVRTKAAMSATQGGQFGGYLVPTELQLYLMESAAEQALIRPRALVVPMATETLQLPLPDATTIQAAGTSPYFGGILLQWLAEAQTRPESEPTFRQVELNAQDLSGYAVSSRPLLQDGGAGLEAYLRRLFAAAVAWYEDYAFLRGDGAGKPQGFLNSGGAVVVNRSGAGTFTITDVANMSKSLAPGSWLTSIWVVHPTVWPQLVTLGTTQWQINHPGEPGAVNRPHGVLNGRPLFVSEKVPALGTKGDVQLIDPTLYVIGDRQAIEIAASEHVNFLKNQITWRILERVDGRTWFDKTITLSDGTSVVSPYVVLN